MKCLGRGNSEIFVRVALTSIRGPLHYSSWFAIEVLKHAMKHCHVKL